MMKRSVFIIVILTLAISCQKENDSVQKENASYNQDGSPVTMAQAEIIMKDVIKKADIVYLYPSVVPADEQFRYYSLCSKSYITAHTPPYESWLFLVNPYYGKNITTYYDYYFVNTRTGVIEHQQYEGAPDSEYEESLFSSFPFETLKHPESISTKSDESRLELMRGFNPVPVSPGEGNTYAVIIDGGNCQYDNHLRYWNNCQFLYRTLKLKYGLTDSNIFTLICGGPSGNWYFSNGYAATNYLDFDYDGIDDIDYAATSLNIDDVFDDIADLAAEGDNLLVFVTDHGGHDSGGSFIYLWGYDSFYADELNDQLMKINSEVKIHVVLGQCYSGGFISELSLCNVSVTTACLETEQSNWCNSNHSFDEFLYRWICAIAEMDPSGTPITNNYNNGDGFVSFYEAFLYARDNDCYYHGLNNIYETPQYYCLTPFFGENHDIVGNYCYVPRFILGGSTVDVGYYTSRTLYLTDIPTGITPSFDVSSYLYKTSSGHNYVVFRYNGSQPIQTGNSVSFSFTYGNVYYSGIHSDITGWKSGAHNNSDAISLSYGGSPTRFTLPSACERCSNIVWGSSIQDWIPIAQGHYFIYFDICDTQPQSSDYVYVTFNNPLSESMTITRNILDSGYTED